MLEAASITTTSKMKLEGTAWANFIGAIKSSESRETYSSKLILFGRYCQQFRPIETPNDLLSDSREVETWIIQWLMQLKNQGLAFNTIWNARNALKKFYSCNDIELRWKKMGQYLPQADIAVEDRPYTRDKIAKLLGVSSQLRLRALILLLCSSGMRIGGALSLKLKHIKKVDDVYQFHVYANSPERYICFCSREAAQAIELYLKDRESCFENLTPESYLFRSVYRRVRKTKNQQKPAGQTIVFAEDDGRVFVKTEL